MISFPNDFVMRSHPIVPGAVQYAYPEFGENRIFSVVGGPLLSGDGTDTFEMYDSRIGEVVLDYATAEEINKYLNEPPNEADHWDGDGTDNLPC